MRITNPSRVLAAIAATVGAATILVATKGCAGELEDPARFLTDGGAAGCGDVPTTIFAASCAITNCHNTTSKIQGLDLQAPDVLSRLVDVPATAPMCSGVLVAPGDPEGSVLYTKLTPEACNNLRMPVGPPLPDEQIECVAQWILGLGGGGGTGGGAGGMGGAGMGGGGMGGGGGAGGGGGMGGAGGN